MTKTDEFSVGARYMMHAGSYDTDDTFSSGDEPFEYEAPALPQELPSAVGVIGLGVVGGTVARALKEAGFEVVGHDPYKDVFGDLSKCSVAFVCVSTPGTDKGELDGRAVAGAIEEAYQSLPAEAIVAVKSTVVPGTNDALQSNYPNLRFASTPEFLTEAEPDESFANPARIVIGARDGIVAWQLTQILRRTSRAPVVHCQPIEAELIKLSSNAMLAAKVTMANELSHIAASFGVHWEAVQEGVGLDPRIGASHLNVTPEGGYGGSCFPKDVNGLIVASEDSGYRAELLEKVAGLNRRFRGPK